MLLTYATKEAQKDRVREVGPAWQMAVARAAVRVGRVRQARERALEVEEKDAVPFRVEAGESRLHGPAPLRWIQYLRLLEMNDETPARLKHLSAS